MEFKEVIGLLGRYALLLLLPISNLFVFYALFTPLTLYPALLVLQQWYTNATLLGTNTIFFNGNYAQILPACIAGAAYYLLTILNFTTPMRALKRVKSLAFLLLSFLLLNIVRILIFARLYDKGYNYFDVAHLLAWYFGSTILIVAVWFSNVLLFNIRAIPIYTDIMNIVAATEFFPSLTAKVTAHRAAEREKKG